MISEPTWTEIAWQLLKDLQTGFFYYTLVYFVLRLCRPTRGLREFDWSATIVICCVSVLTLLFWIGSIAHDCYRSAEDCNGIYERATGPYAWAYWLQPALYTLFPLLLWLQRVRQHFLFRFVIAFFLFFNFEKFVILVTSFHRDYLPSSWSMDTDMYLPLLAFSMLWKLGAFCALTAILFSMRPKKDTFAP